MTELPPHLEKLALTFEDLQALMHQTGLCEVCFIVRNDAVQAAYRMALQCPCHPKPITAQICGEHLAAAFTEVPPVCSDGHQFTMSEPIELK